MSNIWKRSLSLLLAVVMVVGMVPMSVFATEQEECVHSPIVVDGSEDATCTVDGYYAEICEICGELICEEYLSATGHSWGEWEVAEDAMLRICDFCGETETEEIQSEEKPELVIEEITLNDAAAVASDEGPAGILWLDQDNQDALLDAIGEGKLAEVVLKSMGRASEVGKTKVYYIDGGKRLDVGIKRNIFQLMDLQPLATKLETALRNRENVPFLVGDTSYDIAMRSMRTGSFQIAAQINPIEIAGTPDNLDELVAAAIGNATIGVYEGGENLTELTKKYAGIYTVTKNDNVSYEWPAPGEENVYDIVTVTMTDCLGTITMSETARLVLKQKLHTVTYMSDGNEYARYEQADGMATRRPLIPQREYYTFKGWDPAVAATVTKDTVYTAKWVITNDNNNNGTPDELETFAVTYKNGYDGGNVKVFENLKLGDTTPKPADPTRPDDDTYTYTFLGWKVQGSTTLSGQTVAATVTGNVTYEARWKKTVKPAEEPDTSVIVEYTVTYHLEDQIWEESVVADEKTNKYDYTDTNTDDVVWQGWYIANDNGEPTDEKYDFMKPVTGDISLVAVIKPDLNNNGIPDGETITIPETGAPYTDKFNMYVFKHENLVDNIVGPVETAYGAYDPSIAAGQPYTVPGNGGIFFKWELADSNETDQGNVYTHHPVMKLDANSNGAPDELEKAVLVVTLPDGTVIDYAQFAKLGYGEIIIEGLNADGTFNCDTVNGTSITVAAKNEDGKLQSYAGKIELNKVQKTPDNGVKLNTKRNSDFSLTAKLSDADLSDNVAGAVNYTVSVTFRDVKEKTDPTLVINAENYDEHTQKEVYDAVMEAPASDTATIVNAQYLAREAEEKTVRVDVEALFQWLEYSYISEIGRLLNGLGIPADKGSARVEDKVAQLLNNLGIPEDKDGHYVEVTYGGAMWMDVDAEVDVPMIAQDVANAYINDFIDRFVVALDSDTTAGVEKLMQELAFLADKLEKEVDAKADIHPFAYSGEKEIVNLVYTNNDEDIKLPIDGVELKLDDKRDAYTLNAADSATVKYGASDDADIIAMVAGGHANLILPVGFEDQAVGTYTNVSVVFPGSATYKPARDTFKLMIEKVAATVDVPSVIRTTVDRPYNAIETDPDDLDLVHVIVGMDLTEADLDPSKNIVDSKLSGVDIKAWVQMPNSIRNLMAMIGMFGAESEMASVMVPVQTLMDRLNWNGTSTGTLGDVNEFVQSTEYAQSKLAKLLNMLSPRLNSEMEVIFAGEVAPKVPGIYGQMAASVDGNYLNEVDIGMILINPVPALPNPGTSGLQLYLENPDDPVDMSNVQNIYELRNDGQPKVMKVKYNDEPVEADVYYYGINSGLAVHYDNTTNGKTPPSEPGAYIAATVYYAENAKGEIEKFGSDSAIIVIGVEKSFTEVKRTTVDHNGEKHKIDYEIRNEEGVVNDAALTWITAEVDPQSISMDWQNINGSINISFPEGMCDAWTAFANYWNGLEENYGTKMYPLPTDIHDAELNREYTLKFLNWVVDKVNSDRIDNKLDSMDVTVLKYTLKFPSSWLDKVEGWALRLCNKLIAEVNKMPENAEITFKKYEGFDKKGIYLHTAIVTDPDYIPSADMNLLIIMTPEDDFQMIDTTVPYDGKGHAPEMIIDNTGREGFMIVTAPGKSVTFVAMDEDMKATLNKLEGWIGINGKTIGEIFGNSEAIAFEKATKYADDLISSLKDRAIAKIEAKFGFDTDEFNKEKYDEAIAKLNNKINSNAVHDALVAKLVEISKLNPNVVVYTNGELPVNVGTYEFHAYNYAIAKSVANLTIAPIQVKLTASDAEKVYDNNPNNPNPSQFAFTPSYWSKQGLGNDVEDKEVALPNGMTLADLQLITERAREQGEAVLYDDEGNIIGYKIFFTKAEFTGDKKPEYIADEILTVPGTFTIKPKEITEADVELDGELSYNAKEQEQKVKGIGKVVLDKDFTVTDNKKTNVKTDGSYILTVTGTGNYTGKVELPWNINPAKVTVTAKSYIEEDAVTVGKKEEMPSLEAADAYTVVGLMGDDKLEVTLSTNADVNVRGTYDIIVTVADNSNYDITVVNGQLEVGLGDYVCWDMKNTYYHDLSEALDDVDDEGAADYGYETIQMLKDYEEVYVIVASGTTLDLNGYTVTARYVSAFDDADIIDNTRKGTLKVSKKNIYLDQSNAMVPVWNTEDGYKFTEIHINDYGQTVGLTKTVVDGVNVAVFKYITFFRDTDLVANGVSDNDLSIEIVANWKPESKEDGDPFKHFVYGDTHVQQVIAANGKECYKLTVAGYENFEDLTFTAKVISGTGAEFVGSVIPVN